ncbi:MAG: SpoIIE family protein phosphatase [Desulfomicrobium sp.]|nr:SpoIIE family protein phosphatase [Desulfomicrobium sp.]
MRDTTPSILIVDDEPLNIRLLDIVLKQNGYQAISATSGAVARDLAKKHMPDLILLDVMMPKEDGYSTCKELKKNPSTADIPVIFISALTDTASKVQGLEAGGVDFISKPFEKAEVLARVKVHLKLRFAYQALIETQAQRLAQVQNAQQSFLVTPEELPEAGFFVHFEPMHEAGGDFYEVLPVGGTIYDYIVADVSGHDLGTSYITSALKALLSQNCNLVTSPEESLRMINSVLCRILGNGTHITMGFARLNRKQGQLIYTNAGHPAPILIKNSGEVEVLHCVGDILGVFDNVTCESVTIPVSLQDRLFMYTDGLIEGFGNQAMHREKGLATLVDLCRQSKALPLDQAIKTIQAAITKSDHTPEDDTILMGIEI